VPVGALLYVHPLLPPRAGDLAVVAVGDAPPALASVERRSNALIALIGNGGPAVDLNDPSVVSAERVAGMWFP
jgi:hypothetical protein